MQAWFATYDRKFPHFNVEIDGRKIPNGYFTIALNSNPYTYIGKKAVNLSSAASLDKKLVAVTFRKLTTPLMMRTILNAIRTEGISVSSGVDIRTDVENINISFPTPFPYQLDGDYLGEQTSLHIEHRQDALRLVKPIIV
jgi:diacylglycerol kinase family enzyme